MFLQIKSAASLPVMFPLRVGSIHRRGTFQAEFSARRSTAIIVSQRWSPVGQHKAIPNFELRFMGNTVRLYTSKVNGALTTTRCVVRKEKLNWKYSQSIFISKN
ncbi:hypothetical protein AVEN_23130-1 [Araneus ventricosus]|uniref:Uncharacterized protein n=1 Tax=Araneus ventricosus TaxID=182803 RepID=A0A4Y2WY89_ARAVE|nr:hypothetical protein AVEN_23130-1 [Araneus ventricosus]